MRIDIRSAAVAFSMSVLVAVRSAVVVSEIREDS